MNENCELGECADPKYENVPVIPSLPTPSDGGSTVDTEGIQRQINTIKEDVNTLSDLVHDQSMNLEASYTSEKVVLKDKTTSGSTDMGTGETTDGKNNVVELDGARSNKDPKGGKAGIMTAFQATQLDALALAYEDETKGITLYSGTSSTNYLSLSESARNYDHVVVVGEYLSEGSSSFHQSVSTEFYPNGDTNAFQLNAIDIVANAASSSQTTLQDIWQLSEDGLEIGLVAGFKSTIMGGATPTVEVTPEPTSIFTITKVVGYGKKL